MAADADDYFQKVSRSTATTLSAPGYTIGNTTINVGSTANWGDETGVTFAIDEVDSDGVRIDGTYNVFRGVVSSATQVSDLTYVGGDPNRDYTAGATTRVYILVSAYRDNRLVDGLLVSHDQDGTLKAGAVDNAAVLANEVVETAKIKDLNVTTAKIADGAVTPAKLLAGTGTDWVWQSWTPTLTNMTLGNGTVVAKYVQVGKTVHYTFKFTLGSTSAMSSSPEFSVPVTINSSYTDFLPIGHSGVFDNSTSSVYLSAATPSTTSKIRMFVTGASSTHAVLAGISSTVPMTWATSDILWSVGTYEAA